MPFIRARRRTLPGAGRRGRRPLRWVVVPGCRLSGRGGGRCRQRRAEVVAPYEITVPLRNQPDFQRPRRRANGRFVNRPYGGIASGCHYRTIINSSAQRTPYLFIIYYSVFIRQEKHPGNPGRFFCYVTSASKGLFAYLARALSAFAISSKMPACFLATIALMTSRTQIMRAISMTRQMAAFLMKGAIRKPTALTHTTVMA